MSFALAVLGLLQGSALAGPWTLSVERAVEGERVRVRVGGGVPGEPFAVLASTSGVGAGPCLPSGRACAEVLAPQVFGPATFGQWGPADPVNVGLLLDLTGADEVAVQVYGARSGLSDVARLRVLRAGGDVDADGADDLLEDAFGTDPYDPDSDDDGVPDGPELAYGTDPLDPDSDDDWLGDRQEARQGTDPLDPDSDGDGLLDGLDVRPLDVGPAASPSYPELPATDEVAVPDPEFHEPTGQAVWQTQNGRELWLADVDPVSGDLVPYDGRGTLLATDVAPMSWSLNGPEFFEGPDGVEVCFVGLGAAGEQPMRVRPDPVTGAWVSELLPDATGGARPFGTSLPGDPQPLVIWFPEPIFPSPVRIQPWGATSPAWDIPHDVLNARFVPGQRRAAVTAIDATGWSQVWTWDEVDGFVARTSAPFHHMGPFVVSMPERGGQEVIVSGRGPEIGFMTELVVYEEVGGAWQPLHVISPPPGLPYVESPEVFVHDGRTYALFGVTTDAWFFGTTPPVSLLWLASLDPASPEVSRAVCRALPTDVRDPEPYLGPSGPTAYLTWFRPEGGRRLRRCALGL